jgi:hypothetical protein
MRLYDVRFWECRISEVQFGLYADFGCTGLPHIEVKSSRQCNNAYLVPDFVLIAEVVCDMRDVGGPA